MAVLIHHLDHFPEQSEVMPLLGHERMLIEKLNKLVQLIELPDTQLVTIAVILPYDSDIQFFLDPLKHRDITHVLYKTEFWKNLISERHLRELIDSDMETSFAINKSCDPTILQPFLLIIRTPHFVTADTYAEHL
jgi:hypothetical protein